MQLLHAVRRPSAICTVKALKCLIKLGRGGEIQKPPKRMQIALGPGLASLHSGGLKVYSPVNKLVSQVNLTK
jgi:hypothetical protein